MLKLFISGQIQICDIVNQVYSICSSNKWCDYFNSLSDFVLHNFLLLKKMLLMKAKWKHGLFHFDQYNTQRHVYHVSFLFLKIRSTVNLLSTLLPPGLCLIPLRSCSRMVSFSLIKQSVSVCYASLEMTVKNILIMSGVENSMPVVVGISSFDYTVFIIISQWFYTVFK